MGAEWVKRIFYEWNHENRSDIALSAMMEKVSGGKYRLYLRLMGPIQNIDSLSWRSAA